jgi:hypothetical protein
MKRHLLTVALILQGFVAFTQSARLEVYVELYNESPAWQDKLAVLRDLTALKLDDSAEFYAKAFRDLTLAYHSVRNGTVEWADANNIAHVLIAELVSARHEAAGDDLWRSFQIFTDSTVRAEVLAALGELKIESHYNDVVQTVNWLNAKGYSTNWQNDESLAIGGFSALEKYGKPEGYLPAFIGSESWYRELVKQTARSTATALLQDPALLLTDIILSAQYSPLMKQKALAYVDNAGLEASQKAEIASKSLLQGWRNFSTDQRVLGEFAILRLFSLQMIRKYGSNGEKDTYAAMERSLREGNLDEKLDCISALGALDTPESAAIVVSYVQRLNSNRLMSNSQAIDDRLMRSFVPVLRELSDPQAKDTLRQAQSAPWSNTVLNMVSEAVAN